MYLDRFHRVAVDHASNPCNWGKLAEYNGYAVITGPCGDTMEFWIYEKNGKIKNISYTTDGCAPSIACGSMATKLAKGIKITKINTITQQKILDALIQIPKENEHCALLASNTLKAAFDNLTKSKNKYNEENSVLNRLEGESEEVYQERLRIHKTFEKIQNKIVVMSGKGGVGKSTVATTLATSLMLEGNKVGLLDIDLHGPSIPTMLGLEGEKVMASEGNLYPVELDNLKVMSIGFFLETQDDAVIWRGPRKLSIIKQFLADVIWGELDYLIIDVPPGTGDEHLSICQLIGTITGAVLVTTPQKISEIDVRKSINFCKQINLNIIGIIENMNGFVCPKCGETLNILSSGGGKNISDEMNIKYLGSIPIDSKITEACDSGYSFLQNNSETESGKAFKNIISSIINNK